MSSHHVVREKQEPALLVLGLNGFDDELLGQLLEWSPTVIVSGNAAEEIHALGIKIDWIISADAAAIEQEHVKLIPVADGNIVQSALKYLVEQGYPAVNVVTYQLDLNDYIPFVNDIDLVILHHNKKIYPVRSGFSKWKPAGDTIEVISEVVDLQTTGLEPTDVSLFQTINDGFFSLTFNQPFLFIAEAI